jgi:hypothetical protein
MEQKQATPGEHIRCDRCGEALVLLRLARLLNVVKVECRKCGRKRWWRPAPETPAGPVDTGGTRRE